MLATGSQQPVGFLAATRPTSVRVFHRLGIDFGWEGGMPLARVCERLGLDPAGVLREIAAEEARGGPASVRWETRPLPELMDFIIQRYHQPLRRVLPELERLSSRVLQLHGGAGRERHAEVLDVIVTLRKDLIPHLAKEEVVLFPWLRAGRGSSAGPLLRESSEEHAPVGEWLARLRQLTDHYRVKSTTCDATAQLWGSLQLLEAELREHMHLENDILFPRALAC